jgi:Pentapeptide repeats (8 copies)
MVNARNFAMTKFSEVHMQGGAWFQVHREEDKRYSRGDVYSAIVSEALQCPHMIALTLETVSGGELMSRRQAYWLVGAILAVIVLGGLVLWWPPEAPANGSNQLGAALLGATIVALAILVSEYLVSTQMREIDYKNSLAARERRLRREEAEEVLERQRGESIDKWVLQFMASFQQDLRRIDLSGRDMSGLYLGACNFLRANLTGTNLSGANLSGAYLAWAYLSEATLKGADLGDADLAGAGLEGADLSGANLCGTNLTRADLTSVKLAGARYDFRTAWPEGFEPQDSGAEHLQT